MLSLHSSIDSSSPQKSPCVNNTSRNGNSALMTSTVNRRTQSDSYHEQDDIVCPVPQRSPQNPNPGDDPFRVALSGFY